MNFGAIEIRIFCLHKYGCLKMWINHSESIFFIYNFVEGIQHFPRVLFTRIQTCLNSPSLESFLCTWNSHRFDGHLGSDNGTMMSFMVLEVWWHTDPCLKSSWSIVAAIIQWHKSRSSKRYYIVRSSMAEWNIP